MAGALATLNDRLKDVPIKIIMNLLTILCAGLIVAAIIWGFWTEGFGDALRVLVCIYLLCASPTPQRHHISSSSLWARVL